MINPNELLFVVDENNQPQNPVIRHVAHAKGLWHRTSGIWVINSKKQILTQKRSLNKDIKPGFWEAFFGGHLAPDEDYAENALREVREELGISVTPDQLIPYKILKSDKPTHKEFQGIFALKTDQLDNFHIEKEEVDEIRWIDLEKLKDILLNDTEPNWVKKSWDKDILSWLTGIENR